MRRVVEIETGRPAGAPRFARAAALALAGGLLIIPAATAAPASSTPAANGAASANGAAHGRDLPGSFADLVENLTPAVVNISTTQTVSDKQGPGGEQPQLQIPPGSPFEEFFKDFMDRHGGAVPRRVTSLGSGFIIDPKGMIVTNNHVIADADEITVTLTDGTALKAEVAGRDTKTDLAVLRVKPEKPLPFVQFGDSSTLRVGDWVLAIGNPFGLGGSVTAGIISARSRDINAGPYDDFLQTDAAINRGNSGGPLFDTEGRVIGINTAIISPTGGSIGIGFAVPANIAASVVAQLVKYGETRRGWLGVRVQTVTPEIAENLGLAKPQGALVAGVTPGGPADKAGIAAGDVILSFDDKPINEMRDLPRRVADTPVGEAAAVKVWRKGQTRSFHMKLGRLEEAEEKAADAKTATPPTKTVSTLGLSLVPLTPTLRDRYNIGADVKGVLIANVAEGSAAAENGVAIGDVIVGVGQEQEEATSPEVTLQLVQKARDLRQKSVLLLLYRGGDFRFVALRFTVPSTAPQSRAAPKAAPEGSQKPETPDTPDDTPPAELDGPDEGAP